ncbi:MAG: hypothetical protein HY393_04005 [Candidatus Diapherotrites archaeon]|nr:hypothetical protein [Candidatus Diapherotrites archaeon]
MKGKPKPLRKAFARLRNQLVRATRMPMHPRLVVREKVPVRFGVETTLGQSEFKMKGNKPRSRVYLKKGLSHEKGKQVMVHELGHLVPDHSLKKDSGGATVFFSVWAEMEYAKRHQRPRFFDFVIGNPSAHIEADVLISLLFEHFPTAKSRNKVMRALLREHKPQSIFDVYHFLWTKGLRFGGIDAQSPLTIGKFVEVYEKLSRIRSEQWHGRGLL